MYAETKVDLKGDSGRVINSVVLVATASQAECDAAAAKMVQTVLDASARKGVTGTVKSIECKTELDSRMARLFANQPTFVWATPWPGDKTQLRFVFTQPISAVSPQAREWEGGFGQQFIAAQLARDLGGGVGVSYMLGGYQTTGTLDLKGSLRLSEEMSKRLGGDVKRLTTENGRVVLPATVTLVALEWG